MLKLYVTINKSLYVHYWLQEAHVGFHEFLIPHPSNGEWNKKIMEIGSIWIKQGVDEIMYH